MDESASRERRARAIAREIAAHERAIGTHEKAVAKFTAAGHVERAEAARTRLRHTQKLLRQAREQGRELLQEGYAAMRLGSGPDEMVHAVGGGRPVSMCGLEAGNMVGVAEHFSSIRPERRCFECVAAIENDG